MWEWWVRESRQVKKPINCKDKLGGCWYHESVCSSFVALPSDSSGGDTGARGTLEREIENTLSRALQQLVSASLVVPSCADHIWVFHLMLAQQQEEKVRSE